LYPLPTSLPANGIYRNWLHADLPASQIEVVDK
jgi:hypothetical protein